MNKKLGVLLISCLILVGISSLSTPIKEIKACTSESSPPTSYIYAMGSDGPVATLYKIDLSTFNNVSTLYFPNSQVGDNLATYGNYIYADTLDVPSQIYKIALNSFSEVSEITLAPGQGDGNYMVAYNGSLYVGLGTDPTSEPFAAIVKVDLSTFTETAVLPLEKGTGSWSDLIVYNGYLYAADVNFSAPYDTSYLYKINLSTFTISSVLTLPEGYLGFMSMKLDGHYLYASNEGNDTFFLPGPSVIDGIVKIDLNTFSVVNYCPLRINAVGEIEIVGNYLYDASTSGEIDKVYLPTFTDVSTIFVGVDNFISSAVAGNDLYLGAGLPGRVDKVDLSTFTNVSESAVVSTPADVTTGYISQLLYIPSVSSTPYTPISPPCPWAPVSPPKKWGWGFCGFSWKSHPNCH